MKRKGFTLIELLISIILMLILLLAVTMVFMQTTETVANAEARSGVYLNSRYVFDMMQADAMGLASFQEGKNRFIMENMKVGGIGLLPIPDTGNHVGTAADKWTFRAFCTVADTMQVCEVTYELIPGDHAVSHGIPAGNCGCCGQPGISEGDPNRGRTVRTNRPLYTLIRRTRVLDPTQVDPTLEWDQYPKDSSDNEIPDMEICHYVISLNFEFMASTPMDNESRNLTFSQLEDPGLFGKTEPLGDGKGDNDTVTAAGTITCPVTNADVDTPIRIPAVRVTLVLVDDWGERQERVFTKVLNFPTG